MTMHGKPFTLFAVAAIAAAFFSGCANYRLGTTLPSNLRTVSVETFKNLTGEPRLETALTSEILKEFQFDGQLKVKDDDEADILLVGTINSFELRKVVADRNNPKRTLRYDASIAVSITATERATGKVITSTSVTGSKTFNGTGDLATARRLILPDVEKDLAKKVVDAVVSAW